MECCPLILSRTHLPDDFDVQGHRGGDFYFPPFFLLSFVTATFGRPDVMNLESGVVEQKPTVQVDCETSSTVSMNTRGCWREGGRGSRGCHLVHLQTSARFARYIDVSHETCF